MRHSLKYSLKVWLTAVFITPLLIALASRVLEPSHGFDNVTNFFGTIAYMFAFGLVLSIPSWLLLWMFTTLLSKSSLGMASVKAILSVIGVMLSIFPFIIIFSHDDNPLDPDVMIWVTSYSIVIVVGLWFYKLKGIESRLRAE